MAVHEEEWLCKPHAKFCSRMASLYKTLHLAFTAAASAEPYTSAAVGNDSNCSAAPRWHALAHRMLLNTLFLFQSHQDLVEFLLQIENPTARARSNNKRLADFHAHAAASLEANVKRAAGLAALGGTGTVGLEGQSEGCLVLATQQQRWMNAGSRVPLCCRFIGFYSLPPTPPCPFPLPL